MNISGINYFLILGIIGFLVSFYFLHKGLDKAGFSFDSVSLPWGSYAKKDTINVVIKNKENWRKANLFVDLVDIDGEPNSYVYSIKIPSLISVETDEKTHTDYLKYEAKDGYQYSFYPSDIAANNINGPVWEDVQEEKEFVKKIGNFKWNITSIKWKDGSLEWFMFSEDKGRRYSFDISFPKSESEAYEALFIEILATFDPK